MTNYREILRLQALGQSQRSMLDELFYGKQSGSAVPYAVINYEYIHRELSKKGVTLTLVHWIFDSEPAKRFLSLSILFSRYIDVFFFVTHEFLKCNFMQIS